MAKFFTPTKLSENIRETPEGFLLCLNVPIARTGWQDYGHGETPLEVGDDGIVKVYRDSAEVFRPQTVASFQGKSITIKHPNDFVNPQNWKQLTVGVAQNIRKADEQDEDGEESLLADLLITDSIAIGLVRNGLREVSCGYEAEYEQTGAGKGKQYNIVGNHIALVEQGRAGSAYAINDSKEGILEMNKLKELADKIRALGKTADDMMQPKAKDSEEEKKAKDAEEEKKPKDAEEAEKSKDAEMYDELCKMVKDLGDKLEGMKASKDEEKPADKEAEKKAGDEDEEEEKSKDASENEAEGEILDRVKALEAAVAKMLSKAGDEDEEESEDSDEEMSGSEDEDMEESEDEESEEKKEKTGDEARAEILSPGVKVTKGEDLKVKALKAAYATDEGKEVINTLTGGKKLALDSKEQVSLLFVSASELLKAKRGTGLEKTKDGRGFAKDDDGQVKGAITPEKLNEINASHYANKK